MPSSMPSRYLLAACLALAFVAILALSQALAGNGAPLYQDLCDVVTLALAFALACLIMAARDTGKRRPRRHGS